MPELTFVTTNPIKIKLASHVFAERGLKLVLASPHIDEIQSEDNERIARHKAEATYALLRKPVVVSDDSWSIPGLNGFPGPYMKSMGHWFTVDDFLRLTSTLEDRTTVLHQLLVYQDEQGQKLFKNDIKGEIQTESRGQDDHPWVGLVCLEGDNGKTIAEVRAESKNHATRDAAKIWHEFAQWYQDNRA